MVLLDRQLTIDEVANRLQISHGAAYEITHNRLSFHKFVQEESQTNTVKTPANKIWIAMKKKVTPSRTQIITGDETWVHHYELECKQQSMEWKHPQLPIRKMVKSQHYNI
jgi:hypothetical protein